MLRPVHTQGTPRQTLGFCSPAGCSAPREHTAECTDRSPPSGHPVLDPSPEKGFQETPEMIARRPTPDDRLPWRRSNGLHDLADTNRPASNPLPLRPATWGDPCIGRGVQATLEIFARAQNFPTSNNRLPWRRPVASPRPDTDAHGDRPHEDRPGHERGLMFLTRAET